MFLPRTMANETRPSTAVEEVMIHCAPGAGDEPASGYCVWSCACFKDSCAQTVISFSSHIPAQFSHQTSLGFISIRNRLGHRSTSMWSQRQSPMQVLDSVRVGFLMMTAFPEQSKYTLEYIKHKHRIHEILRENTASCERLDRCNLKV